MLYEHQGKRFYFSIYCDEAISEALEEQADKALCKAYCEYLQERLADNSKWIDAMIYKLQEQAQTEEQLRELSRIKRHSSKFV